MPINESVHTRIERERRQSAPKGTPWSMLKTFREYARGQQRGTLNADQMKIMASVIKNPFADNVLRKILWEHANRLRIARWDVADERVSDFLFDLWVKNALPDLFADATFATLRDGNHAIALNWVPDLFSDEGGRVLLTRERWWDGIDGVFVMYGDDARPVYAVKEWQPVEPGARKRRNIYYPESIWRFEWDGGQWQPYNLPSDPEILDGETNMPIRGIVPWLKRDGTPLGIPIVHLPNGSDDDSLYGASLLDGGALAFQDQINAVQHDVTAAAMLNGSPQTWSRGFELPTDPNDPSRKVRVVMGPGRHHHNDEVTAEWGNIQPGDLSELRNAYMMKLEALCRNTNTPLRVFTGQWPSGEAIFRDELPIVNSARKLGESVGPSWSTVAHRATGIRNAFGLGEPLDESSLITTIYESLEQRDPLGMWAIVEKAAPFVSGREALRIAGYTPTEIDRIMSEKEKENAEKVSAAQAAFSRPADIDALMRASGQTADEE